jgi:hypothetical protein
MTNLKMSTLVNRALNCFVGVYRGKFAILEEVLTGHYRSMLRSFS